MTNATNFTNKDLAGQFEYIATLLELSGENQFKIKAYKFASRIIETSPLSTDKFREKAAAGKIKGFGKGMQEALESMLNPDEPSYAKELELQLPSGLIEILKIPGLGAKKIRTLYQELNITSIKHLEAAIAKNELCAVKGFGEKTQNNILKGISQLKKYSSQFLYDDAYSQANKIVNSLEASKLCTKLSITGSLRRCCEVVKNVDILASSKSPDSLIDFFCNLENISRVIKKNKNTVHAILNKDLPITLNILEHDYSFKTALLYSTGNNEHIRALEKIAETLDITLSKASISKNAKELSINSEDDIYEELHLATIPPEFRENTYELEFANTKYNSQQNECNLITRNSIKGILHTHTNYSDGKNTLREIAVGVKDMGFSYLGVSDHSKSARYANGLFEDAIKKQHEEIDSLNEELFPFYIFKGIESDILKDGSLDYPNRILETFDFIIASVHSNFTLSKNEMTTRIVRAIENPYTNILGHPTGRLLLKREAYQVDLNKVMEAAAVQNVAIELNSHPRRLDLDWRFHKRAKELGILIPISPDAHAVDKVNYIDNGIMIARKGGLEKENVLNCKNRAELIEIFRKK